MNGGPRIAIDAMGGDSGPAAMIAGASRALRKDPSLQFTFYGDERQVAAEIAAHTEPRGRRRRSSTRPKRSRASEKPSQAIRRAAHDLDGHGDQRGEGGQRRRRASRAATPAR